VSFTVGSLVKTRNREWVVLPGSNDDYLLIRPLGGTEDEITAVHLSLEQVASAQFAPPDPTKLGDHKSCRLLRDAIRLSSRSSTGPFRSLAKIAVDPRPYQIVPLLMALKLDPIRLCIADDVGIGKTIEACLIARELLDRGDIQRIGVLCPPHLAEQWQMELSRKFHIDAELVLPSTAARLEKNCRMDQSLFDIYSHVIVSMDFIKSDRRRDEFVKDCPEFIIVDEAHTCAFGFEGKGSRHQRHQLVKKLTEDKNRHIVFVTATPHSGKEETFRSLLTFLDKDFVYLPENLTGKENEAHRRRLAQHFVQRRRADIRHFLTETIFPEREEAEDTYNLSPEYRRLFDRAIRFAQKTVSESTGNNYRQRVRWWSVLALLRSLASSPAAAASTLRERARVANTETVEEADEVGRNSVFDIGTDDLTEGVDITPGSDFEEEGTGINENRRNFLEMAKEADVLIGEKDFKLQKALPLIKKIVDDGYQLIVFCRFIPTADYLAENIRNELSKHYKDLQVISVTGVLPPEERKARVDGLAAYKKRILVCTDCLSEGINLQEHFNAVMHYDLAWSPTRHEQREGRVDRFGQNSSKVRVLTYYSIDNQIDGIVLDVLIRKHRKIRNSLGISVPVPIDTNAVTEAIFEGLLLRGKAKGEDIQQQVFDFIKPQKQELDLEWDNAAEREKRSRTMFAQDAIQKAVVDEVSHILAEVRESIGSREDLINFVLAALRLHKGLVIDKDRYFQLDLKEMPRSLKDMLGNTESFKVRFDLPIADDETYICRTSPLAENLASYIIDTSLDPLTPGIAKRSGAIRTDKVKTRATLLLARFRYDLVTERKRGKNSQLIEECVLLGFEGSPDNPTWIEEAKTEEILLSEPKANIFPEQASEFIKKVIERTDVLNEYFKQEADRRATLLMDAHQRVRLAAKVTGVSYKVEPKVPVDIIGIYVFLPV
jgi:superfamily II DNA or RNA helicase